MRQTDLKHRQRAAWLVYMLPQYLSLDYLHHLLILWQTHRTVSLTLAVTLKAAAGKQHHYSLVVGSVTPDKAPKSSIMHDQVVQ